MNDIELINHLTNLYCGTSTKNIVVKDNKIKLDVHYSSYNNDIVEDDFFITLSKATGRKFDVIVGFAKLTFGFDRVDEGYINLPTDKKTD
jgi:hypothetical protein